MEEWTKKKSALSLYRPEAGDGRGTRGDAITVLAEGGRRPLGRRGITNNKAQTAETTQRRQSLARLRRRIVAGSLPGRPDETSADTHPRRISGPDLRHRGRPDLRHRGLPNHFASLHWMMDPTYFSTGWTHGRPVGDGQLCRASSWAFLGPGRASGWPEKSPTGNPWPEPGPARPTFSKFWPEPGPRPEKARFFPGWPDGPARSNGNFLFSVARARPDIITG
jgi:hypothetical protein